MGQISRIDPCWAALANMDVVSFDWIPENFTISGHRFVFLSHGPMAAAQVQMCSIHSRTLLLPLQTTGTLKDQANWLCAHSIFASLACHLTMSSGYQWNRKICSVHSDVTDCKPGSYGHGYITRWQRRSNELGTMNIIFNVYKTLMETCSACFLDRAAVLGNLFPPPLFVF